LSDERPRNLAASVKQRLMNQTKVQGVEFQRILVLYGLERLLYRISVSPFADEFILKGAILLSLWFDAPYRRTRDIDLLGKDTPSPERFASVFQDLCDITVEEDGLRFAPETVTAKRIREENEFGGVRVQLTAFLDGARIPIQVDIGFGDAAVPEPEQIEFPVLLSGFPAPVLRAYQKETTIAEKLHALVVLERSNSRMKDFFDLYMLSQEFAFEGERLSGAIRDAFSKRGTPIPSHLPDGLSLDFASDPDKQSQWKAFLRQSVAPPQDSISLEHVIQAVAAFLWPVLQALAEGVEFSMHWTPGDSWIEK
jgi:predicted nucleotidyltransferase component of viral defense system